MGSFKFNFHTIRTTTSKNHPSQRNYVFLIVFSFIVCRNRITRRKLPTCHSSPVHCQTLSHEKVSTKHCIDLNRYVITTKYRLSGNWLSKIFSSKYTYIKRETTTKYNKKILNNLKAKLGLKAQIRSDSLLVTMDFIPVFNKSTDTLNTIKKIK